MPATSAHDTEVDWASAWAAALDELELTLDETERLFRGEAGEASDAGTAVATWAPPALEGPIPVDLRTRALALHHRQQQVLRAAAEAAAGLRRQAALTSRMSTATHEPRPVYLDITA
jgi:hypothetical protein